jgi:hypothetical protein
MNTPTKNTNSPASAASPSAGSLPLTLLASPLGWLADEGRPVPLRDRPPHGDRHDRLLASVSAAVWSVALVVAAIWAQADWSWLAVLVCAVTVLTIVPLRVVIARGGEDRPPQRTKNNAGGRRKSSRLPMVLWALGLAPANSYATIDRRENDEDGSRGRRRRRVGAAVLLTLPTVLLTLDAAVGLPLARWADTLLTVPIARGVVVTGGMTMHAVLALLILAWAWSVTAPVGRYHAEDLAITGTDAEHPGMAGPMIAALSISYVSFDIQSELHWNRPRDHESGFHAVSVSGATAHALGDPDKREEVGRLYNYLEITGYDHRSFRLEPVTDAERARREALAASEGLVSGFAGDGDDAAWDDSEPVTLDTDDITWNPDEDGGDAR